jgi:hypothetical protein
VLRSRQPNVFFWLPPENPFTPVSNLLNTTVSLSVCELSRDIKFDQMDLPLPEDYTPVTSNSQSGNELPEGVTTNAELRQAFERMYARQQQMEAELASARAALYGSQPAQQPPAPEPSPPAEVPMNDLIRTLLETLNATSPSALRWRTSGTPRMEASLMGRPR